MRFFSLALVLGAASAITFASGSMAQSVGFDHSMYDALLQKYVVDGRVDYAALKSDRASLDSFIRSMGAVSRAEVDAWPVTEQLAFWIDAYNAITLAYIIDHYPIRKSGIISGVLYPANSIRQIPGVWDKLTTPVAGSPITLDAIEHQVLRKKFSEPRIHFAIVCASVGCPPLRNEAFTAEKLEDQLEDQTQRFLSHPDRFRIDRDRAIVYLSPIFEWFGKDFSQKFAPTNGQFADHDATTAAVLNFIAPYVSETDRQVLMGDKFKVSYSDYDWSLNEQ